jgi:DNA-binding HxlR family transcriptional regulator
VSTRVYGQYCGFARALEMVGERWSLLIVRDLFVGPKRFTDLHRGLAGIPTNVLTSRLKELEEAGVVRRRVLARPERAVVYELTKYGNELEDVVVRLGRWGAKSLGEPRPDEIITVDSMIMAMRSTFRQEAARKVHVSYELRMGPVILHVRVDDGSLEVGAGALPHADLIIETGPALKALMSGEVTPAEAIKSGKVRLTGSSRLLKQFAELFPIAPMPAR